LVDGLLNVNTAFIARSNKRCTLILAIKARKSQCIVQVGASCGAWFIAPVGTVAVVVINLRSAQYNVWVVDTFEAVCFVVFAN
jgi:hypothetical protein